MPAKNNNLTFAQKFLYMTNDQIEKYLLTEQDAKRTFRIHFKTRNTMSGIFITTGDYEDLKSKNFWRIVTGVNIDTWKKSKDQNLARIFNGSEITKLSVE
jgi:hypothetical protein